MVEFFNFWEAYIHLRCAASFFNPCCYMRSLQNLALFEMKLRKANIPYFSAEMVIGEQPPMLANPTLRFYSKSNLFYKEQLWNRLEKEIPQQYTKIVFLDSDIIFSIADWVDKLSDMLNSHDLVHPYTTMTYLDLSYSPYNTLTSSVINKSSPSTGFGWAITRPFFSKIGGFYEKSILGSGDTLFFNAIFPEFIINDRKTTLMKDAFNVYKANMQICKPSVSNLPCKLYHLCHGSLNNRNYTSRYQLFTDLNLKSQWDTLFSLNTDGFWELNSVFLNDKLLEYFRDRKEDSLDSDHITNRMNGRLAKPASLAIALPMARPVPVPVPVQQPAISHSIAAVMAKLNHLSKSKKNS